MCGCVPSKDLRDNDTRSISDWPTMSLQLLVEYQDARWRLNVDGERYGSFPTRLSAELTAIQLAKAMPALSPKVIVRGDDYDELVWDECQLIENLWHRLRSASCGLISGFDAEALRGEVARRVLHCAQCDLSQGEVVDLVLISFGMKPDMGRH
jgi:hypothetical protein